MTTALSGRIQNLLIDNEGELHKLPGEWSDVENLRTRAERLISAAQANEYHTIPRQLAHELKVELGDQPENCAQWGWCFMLTTMELYFDKLIPSNYPRSVMEIIEREANRVLDTLAERDNTYVLNADVYIKDLMCFTGRLVPCGMYVIDLYAGFPRSYLLKPNLRSFIPNAWFLFKAGGFRRYAQVHVHQPTLKEFSEAGRDACFNRIGEIMKIDEGLLGIMGSAWYYDPKVSVISPHLSYLSKTPVSNGARLFKLGETTAARENAMSRSKARRILVEAGEYRPHQYAMLWPRDALFGWLGRVYGLPFHN